MRCRDIKGAENEKRFEFLVAELKHLEETGVSIKSGEQIFQVHFIITLIVGDNFGLNAFLNFNNSFSSNFFCRLCKADKRVTHKQSTEETGLMRTITNYAHLKVNNNKQQEL